ncbi:hypothetical protein [Streptomyces gobitricini]
MAAAFVVSALSAAAVVGKRAMEQGAEAAEAGDGSGGGAGATGGAA